MVRRDDRAAALVPRGGKSKITRRLAAVFCADISGFSALMGRAEEQTYRRVGVSVERVYREIEKSQGRVFSSAGDGVMAEFPSAIEAIKCALRVHADRGRRNAKLPPDEWIQFRIGLNAGEIMIQGDRTGGTTVNLAARLEAFAEPGGVCLSASVVDQVKRTVTAPYEPLGEQRFKNIREPVSVYKLDPSACSSWVGMAVLPRANHPDNNASTAGRDYRPSLAILPFRSLQKDQLDSYFAEGMTDDIIRALGGLKDLLVISRSSTIDFARTPLDLRRVGHDLDVRYVLHGSVRRAGDALRIAVELNEAQTGSVIWADRFDGDLVDLFDLQDRIALRVATAIAPHLRQRELDLALRKHPRSMTAYDLTLRALGLFHRMDRASIIQAQELLGHAISHDADYAPAYSHLASLHMRWVGQGWSEDEAADRAKAANAAKMALERDPNDALALAIYGHMKSYLRMDYEDAQRYLERALAAGPSCAFAWGYSSLTCGYLGEIETAIARAEHAVRLSPLGVDTFWLEHYLSQAYYLGRRYEDAVAWGRTSAAHAGSNTSNLRCLIASLVAAGQNREARKYVQQLMHLVPTFTLESFRARTPLSHEVREEFVGRLRLAGVPN